MMKLIRDFIFYHTTSKRLLPEILKYGLIPKTPRKFAEVDMPSIYLALTPEASRAWALNGEQFTEEPITLKVKVPKNTVIHFDPESSEFAPDPFEGGFYITIPIEPGNIQALSDTPVEPKPVTTLEYRLIRIKAEELKDSV